MSRRRAARSSEEGRENRARVARLQWRHGSKDLSRVRNVIVRSLFPLFFFFSSINFTLLCLLQSSRSNSYRDFFSFSFRRQHFGFLPPAAPHLSAVPAAGTRRAEDRKYFYFAFLIFVYGRNIARAALLKGFITRILMRTHAVNADPVYVHTRMYVRRLVQGRRSIHTYT